MKLKKIAILFCLGLAACDDPGACNKMNAAKFFVDYQATHGTPVDWSLKYISKEYILKVEKTGYTDRRYGTKVCRAVIKNDLYGWIHDDDSKPSTKACFVYIPSTNTYSIATGLPDCCSPYYVDNNNKFCYF